MATRLTDEQAKACWDDIRNPRHGWGYDLLSPQEKEELLSLTGVNGRRSIRFAIAQGFVDPCPSDGCLLFAGHAPPCDRVAHS